MSPKEEIESAYKEYTMAPLTTFLLTVIVNDPDGWHSYNIVVTITNEMAYKGINLEYFREKDIKKWIADNKILKEGESIIDAKLIDRSMSII